MRPFMFLGLSLGTAALLGVACGEREDGSGFPNDQPQGNPADASPIARADSSLGSSDAGDIGDSGLFTALSGYRLDPPVATLDVSSDLTTQPTLKWKALAKENGSASESDVTAKSVFYLAVNPTLGSFASNGPVFSPNSSLRGGEGTVRGRITNGDGTILEADAKISVRLTATLVAGAGVPANAATLFARPVGTAASRKPSIVYPASGTMLPPNLGQFELHFKPGVGSDVYEVTYQSATLTLKQDITCATKVDSGCIAALDQTAFDYLAQSNRGQGSVTVKVSGTATADTQRFESDPITIQFAESDVRGAIYYWRVENNDGKIMRTEFGSPKAPEVFLSKGQDGIADCIGCHALSRDGKRMVGSTGGQNQGRQVLVPDLGKAKSDPKFFAKKEDTTNRIQFAAFNPTGDRFVSVYGDTTNASDRNKLWMNDATTGDRIASESISLNVEPSHVAWSPDGNTIAFSEVGVHNTSQRPKKCGISMVTKAASGWNASQVVVPSVAGKNRYNPDFSPESNVLLFSESTCPSGDNNSEQCDGDDDPTASTWAAKPAANATPVKLANAGSPGITDGQVTSLYDTFARSTPFVTNHNGGKLFWVTISSRRREGLRNTTNKQQLWMFAVDPAKILSGTDGSFKPFFLPFQDLASSNHIAQWTANLISESNPVPTPPPPSGGPPPPPPR